MRRLSRRAQDHARRGFRLCGRKPCRLAHHAGFRLREAASQRYRRAVELAFDAARERMRARAGLTALAMFLVVASIVGVLWFGAAAVIDGSMTVGRLSQFVLYAVFAGAAFAAALGGLGRGQPGRRRRRAADGAARRRAGDPLAGRARAASRHRRAARSSFDNVRFAYPGRPAGCRAQRRIVSRHSPARRWPSSARRAPARARSSICSCASSIRSPARSASTASTLADADLDAVARAHGASCRRTWRCSPAPSPTTSATAAPMPTCDAVQARRRRRPGRRLHSRAAARATRPSSASAASALGRPAPAHRHRPRDPEGRADPAARRGDERARCRERGAGAARAGAAHGGPHHARHRPPARHRAEGRPHPGDGQGPHRRGRHARRADRARAAFTRGSPKCSLRPRPPNSPIPRHSCSAQGTAREEAAYSVERRQRTGAGRKKMEPGTSIRCCRRSRTRRPRRCGYGCSSWRSAPSAVYAGYQALSARQLYHEGEAVRHDLAQQRDRLKANVARSEAAGGAGEPLAQRGRERAQAVARQHRGGLGADRAICRGRSASCSRSPATSSARASAAEQSPRMREARRAPRKRRTRKSTTSRTQLAAAQKKLNQTLADLKKEREQVSPVPMGPPPAAAAPQAIARGAPLAVRQLQLDAAVALQARLVGPGFQRPELAVAGRDQPRQAVHRG